MFTGPLMIECGRGGWRLWRVCWRDFEPIPIGPEVARIHAEVWARLEAAGAIIGAHDLWIAATALAHGLTVMTANVGEFERVPGLSVLAA